MSYLGAKRTIYLPSYRWVLDNRLVEEIAELRRLADANTVVLLDFTTNDDVEDVATPLSHAALVKRFVEGS